MNTSMRYAGDKLKDFFYEEMTNNEYFIYIRNRLTHFFGWEDIVCTIYGWYLTKEMNPFTYLENIEHFICKKYEKDGEEDANEFMKEFGSTSDFLDYLEGLNII